MFSIPAFDSTERLQYDWTSPGGLNDLKSFIQPLLSFEPREFQLYDSACILNGQDVFCISATGDGKSALIYIPALARKEMITVVVEPTNALENNMVSSLRSKGLASIVINAEEIEDAKKKDHTRNLWDEVKSCQYQVVALSPEMLQSPEFSTVIQDPCFRRRWRVLAVDETHLVDDWGAEFRKAYAAIWSLRARGPDHLTLVAMSASVEKGGQMSRILQRLGYREDTFYLDKRDCQRHNVDIIFRTIQFSHTGFEFRDLDWLVPENLSCASSVPKRIVYSDTIEIGHRIAGYLRDLLPAHLQSSRYTLVRHMHSMNCPLCKKEGLAALEASGADRTTAIFVATAVWEVGLDVPDIESVIMYPAPASASSIIQRAGRPARSAQMPRGEAIVYVKKTDLQAALEYANREPADSRLLDPQNVLTRRSIADGSPADARSEGVPADARSEGVPADARSERAPAVAAENEIEACEHGEAAMVAATRGTIESLREAGLEGDAPEQRDIGRAQVISSATRTLDSQTSTYNEDLVEDSEERQQSFKMVKPKAARGKGKGKSGLKKTVGTKKTGTELPYSEQGKRPCFARLLIIAAHARSLCLSRQINIIYDNPGTDHDCGRCSSCQPRPLPTPRPMPSLIAETPDSTVPASDSDAQETSKIPTYMKPTSAELIDLNLELSVVGRRLWRKVLHGSECLLIGPTSFLRPDVVKRMTTDFHLLSSMDDLEHRIRDNWCYWERAGGELWLEVAGLIEHFRERAIARHERSLETRRDTRLKKEADAVHSDLILKGLGHIKKVKLRVPTLISALDRVAASEGIIASTGTTVPSILVPPSRSSGNPRATTPEPGPVRSAPAILSPSNRAVPPSSSSSPADHVAGESIPVERFYGKSVNPRKRTMQDTSQGQEERPAKAQKTARAQKMPQATTSRKENSAGTLAPRRSKRSTKG